MNQYKFFYDISGLAMKVHNKFGNGLLESAYEAGLEYLLKQKGYKVERQVYLPMYWDNVKLEQSYRMDLVVNGSIILELKAMAHVDSDHRRQLWNYMNLTHLPYGMLINFSNSLYSEWYHRKDNGNIDKINMESLKREIEQI